MLGSMIVVPATARPPLDVLFRLSNAASACLAMASICSIMSSSSYDSNLDGRGLRQGGLFLVVISRSGVSSIVVREEGATSNTPTIDRVDLAERRDLAVAKVSSSLSSSSASIATICTSWSANMSSMFAVISLATMQGVILKFASGNGTASSTPDSGTSSTTSGVRTASSSSNATTVRFPAVENSSSPRKNSSSTACNFFDKCSNF
mmetsp:Transcript_27240/g.57839  ORF Transcript_27240/g.57839 Transcript_27240/m.57839 type:complete len:206 (-) Transcript_27240:1642-2259(-)